MTQAHLDYVKQQIAVHWNRRAPSFDDDFGHSLRTSAEQAAWDRVLGLVLGDSEKLDVLDVGCGTGFVTFQLARRGHVVTGVDFASDMVEQARRKARERDVEARFEEGDAEQLAFNARSFDLVASRHLLWTLPRPEIAIDEWIRVLRPGGRLLIVDGKFDPRGPMAERTDEYAEITSQLPFMGGRPRTEIETLLSIHGLVGVQTDAFEDLIAAQQELARADGIEVRSRERYAVWGEVPA